MPTLQTIVVKVGTNVLTRADGRIDQTTISQLCDQIAFLKSNNVAVILISSGAVGAGKTVVQLNKDLNKIVSRQVYASVGQIRLINIYTNLLANFNIHCAQVLATKEDFRDRVHYINMQQCFRALLRDNILPIVNENDVIAVDELMFTDNDELAGLVAAMINADNLIILSNVDGVYDGPPDDKKSKVIPLIKYNDKKHLDHISPIRSSFGRGGMQTKSRMAQKAAALGINTIIANGKKPGILIDIFKDDFVGTLFKAKSSVSNVKKWIAHNENVSKGSVVVNKGAAEVICAENKVSSLLPVGVVSIEGAFSKGDIIEILNEQQKNLGLGVAQYSSEKARQLIGHKGKKALIHYDYLYIYK